MKEIKRLSLCPNCKSNENVSLHTHTIFNKSGNFWVECDCGVSGEECENPVDAIFNWGLIEVEQLQVRIKELESDKHINEIRAQELKDFNFLFIEPELYKKGLTRKEYFIYRDLHDTLLDLIKKLRNNNE